MKGREVEDEDAPEREDPGGATAVLLLLLPPLPPPPPPPPAVEEEVVDCAGFEEAVESFEYRWLRSYPRGTL